MEVKKILAAQIIALVLVMVPSVFAQTTNRIQPKTATRTAVVAEKAAKIASREAAFKEKVATFKDKARATVVTKINDQFKKINTTRTAQMSKSLDKMTEILNKLQTRVNGVTGKDTTQAKAAIVSAQTAITTAKEAVVSQSAQDYNVVITAESKVGQDAKVVRMKLAEDLKATKALVIAAKQAVANAISTAMSSLGGTNGK